MTEYLIENDGSQLEATQSVNYRIAELEIKALFYDGADKFRVQLLTSTNERSMCESGRWPFQLTLADGRIIGCDPDCWVEAGKFAYLPFLRTYAEKLS